MSAVLPDHLDPWRAAHSGTSFVGQIPVRELPRLLAAIRLEPDAEPTPVHYELEFDVDSDGRARVTGCAKARLYLSCQRCLEAVGVDVEAEIALALLRSDARVSELPADLDPLVVGDEPIKLRDVIEDEVLLALPVVPRHDADQCQGPPGMASTADLVDDDEGSERPSPFAILADLKGKRSA